MTLEVRLHHQFPEVLIDIAFAVQSPGVTVLFGPSGSGKSTVITAAAGLLRPDSCRIAIDGAAVADTEAGIWQPPERRRAGLVFQDSRLFPHMSVRTNLMFGFRRARGIDIRFDEIVDLLGIGALLDRRPHTLSGGERQRVAIGRALLAQPRLLLMDEPLASLDPARKAEILPYLARLKDRLKLPVLYVTHAVDEMMRLADSVVLIKAGTVEAAGPIADLATRADLPLALRDDAGALLLCRVASHDTHRRLTHLDWNGTDLLVPALDLAPGAQVRVRVPAREVILARPPVESFRDSLSLHNVIEGTIRRVAPDTARNAALVEVAVGGSALLARVTPDATERLGLVPGAPVAALVKSMSVELLSS